MERNGQPNTQQNEENSECQGQVTVAQTRLHDIPLVPRPPPRSFVWVTRRQLLNHISILFDDENLLASVTAKSFRQSNWSQAPPTTARTRVVRIKFDLVSFLSLHEPLKKKFLEIDRREHDASDGKLRSSEWRDRDLLL
jgi:hypothetical protein